MFSRSKSKPPRMAVSNLKQPDDEELRKIFEEILAAVQIVDPAMKDYRSRFLAYLQSLSRSYANENFSRYLTPAKKPTQELVILHKTFLQTEITKLDEATTLFSSPHGTIRRTKDKLEFVAAPYKNPMEDGKRHFYEPRSKKFTWDDAYTLALAARLDPDLMPPNKAHIDDKDSQGRKIPPYQRRMLEEAVYAVNKQYPNAPKMIIDNPAPKPPLFYFFAHGQRGSSALKDLLKSQSVSNFAGTIEKDTTSEQNAQPVNEETVNFDLDLQSDTPLIEATLVDGKSVPIDQPPTVDPVTLKQGIEKNLNENPDTFLDMPIVGYTIKEDNRVYDYTAKNYTGVDVFFVIEDDIRKVIRINMQGKTYFEDLESPFDTADPNAVLLDLDAKPIKEILGLDLNVMKPCPALQETEPFNVPVTAPPIQSVKAVAAMVDVPSLEEPQSSAQTVEAPAAILPPEYNDLYGQMFGKTQSEHPHMLISGNEFEETKAGYYQELISGPAHYDDVRDLITRVPELFQGKKLVAVDDFAATILRFNKRMDHGEGAWRLNNDSLINRLKQDGLIETGFDKRLGKDVIKAIAHYEEPELENSDPAFLKTHAYYVETVVNSANGAIATRKDFLEIAKDKALKDLAKTAKEEDPEAFKEAAESFARHDYIKDARRSWNIMVEQGIVSANGKNDKASVTRIAHGLKSIFTKAAEKPEAESVAIIKVNGAAIPELTGDGFLPLSDAEKSVHGIFQVTAGNLPKTEDTEKPIFVRPLQIHGAEPALNAAQ